MDDLACEEKGAPLLEPIATVALDAGRMLMEAGASARTVDGIVGMIAHGLGAERVDLRIGYVSIAITVSTGNSAITRMRKVGPLGVNQQLDQKLRHLAGSVSRRELTREQTRTALARLAQETPRHPLWLIAVAVGLACAAFGRLLGVDWYGTVPVFLAGAVGQYTRGKFLHYHVNAFLCTTSVSFLSCVISGLGAKWNGSTTLATAMIASVLLLVPGVPAFNAQNDILEGYPTLGSARAVTVMMTLVFIAAGLWMGRALLIHWQIL